jgi:opacity protein-like surface antigen
MLHRSPRASGRPCVFLAAALSTALPAHAMDEGFYMGGFYAHVEQDPAIAPFDDLSARIYEDQGYTLLTKESRIKAADSTWGFVVGYRWLPHLAFEGTWFDLSDVRYGSADTLRVVTQDGATIEGSLDSSIKTSIGGPALSAVGILPISYEFELYGRAGAMLSSSELRISQSNFRGSIGDSSTSADWIAAIGASYTFIDVYTARLEYQRVFDAGDDEILIEEDIDTVSLQIVVTF